MSIRVTRSSTRLARMWQLRFPPEVWDIVFTLLGDDEGDDLTSRNNHLKSASTTCRTFNALCERHIWREYTLQIGEKPLQGLATFLKKHPRLAGYIKKLTVNLLIPGVNSIFSVKVSQRWLEQLPNVLDHLHHVKSVSLKPDDRAAIDYYGYEYHLPFIDLPLPLQSSLVRVATAPQVTSLSIKAMHYFPLEVMWAPRPPRFGILIENVECACKPVILHKEPKEATPWEYLSLADDGMHNSLKQLFELFKKKAEDGVESVFVPVDFSRLSSLYWRVGDQHSLDTLKEVLKRAEALEELHIEAPYFNHYRSNQPEQSPRFNLLESLHPSSLRTLRRFWMTSMSGRSAGGGFDIDSFLSELSILPDPCHMKSLGIGPIPIEAFQSLRPQDSKSSNTQNTTSTRDFWLRLGQALGPERFPSLKMVVLQIDVESARRIASAELHLDPAMMTRYIQEGMFPPDANEEGKAKSRRSTREVEFLLRASDDEVPPHPSMRL